MSEIIRMMPREQEQAALIMGKEIAQTVSERPTPADFAKAIKDELRRIEAETGTKSGILAKATLAERLDKNSINVAQ